MEKRKITSVIVIVMAVLALGLILTVQVQAESENQENLYSEYDCSSGEEITISTKFWLPATKSNGYAGDSYSNEPECAAILGGECNWIKVENTTVTKFTRATCSINTTFPDGLTIRGTATMIGPSTALTAAHCVYDASHGGYAKSTEVIPARNLEHYPYGKSSSKKYYIPDVYKTSPIAGNDIAVIILKSAIGKKSGYLGCKVKSINVLTDSYQCGLELLGYPKSGIVSEPGPGSEKVIVKSGEMWGMGGNCSYANGKVMRYDMDTLAGHSGAGLLVDGAYVTGVHKGYSGKAPTYNQGTRIDSEYMKWIKGVTK